MKFLSLYNNGNYQVKLYEDGTKVKLTRDDYFDAEFPDSIDIKITDNCDMLCPMCHEKSSPQGKHAEIDYSLLNTLHKGTELAIGGGNPLTHPKLRELLRYLKKRGIIANLTVHETHLLKDMDKVQRLLDEKLIYGLGVSLFERKEGTFEFQRKNPSVLFHLILGINSLEDIRKLYEKDAKVLLLGYKQVGRGKDYYSTTIENNIAELKEHFLEYRDKFNVLCFDNLALIQLDAKNQISPEEWDSTYMGDDGESTMYIDLVKREFAVSSTSTTRYPLTDNVTDMFKVVKKNKNY